jgi:DNA topoisomerase-2
MLCIFPNEDYPLLKFNYSEGCRVEPKYFIPIIPPIFDTKSLPATGWKIELWGRDIISSIDLLTECIKKDNPLYSYGLKVNTRGHKGRIISMSGNKYSMGEYELKKQGTKVILQITELPLLVWTDKYLTWLSTKLTSMKFGDVDKIITDNSRDSTIDIRIELTQEQLNIIEGYANYYMDGYEVFFMLYNKIQNYINLIGKDGEVITMFSYEDIVSYWYPLRRELYIKRIERRKLLLNMSIEHQKSVICYLTDTEIKPRTELNKLIQQLEKKYICMTPSVINSSEDAFLDNEEIKAKFYTNSNYDYLIDLSDRQKTDESIKKRKEKLETTIKDLEALNKKEDFPGQLDWINELSVLKTNIIEGLKTNWTYGEDSKYTL